MAETSTRILRYEVPVDDRWHEHCLSGPVLHVAARRSDVVEFWAAAESDTRPTPRRFRVVGTGHEILDEVWHRGTALAAGGALVWHLVEAVTGVEPDLYSPEWYAQRRRRQGG